MLLILNWISNKLPWIVVNFFLFVIGKYSILSWASEKQKNSRISKNKDYSVSLSITNCVQSPDLVLLPIPMKNRILNDKAARSFITGKICRKQQFQSLICIFFYIGRKGSIALEYRWFCGSIFSHSRACTPFYGSCNNH